MVADKTQILYESCNMLPSGRRLRILCVNQIATKIILCQLLSKYLTEKSKNKESVWHIVAFNICDACNLLWVAMFSVSVSQRYSTGHFMIVQDEILLRPPPPPKKKVLWI